MVMTVYLTGASGNPATKNAVIADVARRRDRPSVDRPARP
jgi:hypothetical protein